jgi:hypothetical protein
VTKRGTSPVMGDRSVRPVPDTSFTRLGLGEPLSSVWCRVVPNVRGNERSYLPHRGGDIIVCTSAQPNPTVSPTTSHDAPSTRTKKG